MTDCEFVLQELRKGPRDAMQIVMAAIRERDIGLVCHSRVSDLRAQGYVISCAIEGKTRKGRERYVYRLVGYPEAPARPRTAPAVGLEAAADGGSQPAAALVDIDGQLVLLPVPA
jgi:hypothetical protein